MKKLLPILLLAPSLYAATNEADFVKGVDLTSTNYITPSLLNQLVDEAYPATKRGLVIRQSTTPDTTNNTHLTNYIWLDTTTDPSTLKRYNAASNVWDSFSQPIADDSITTAKIVNGAVTTVKIQDLSVTEAKISAGSVTSSKLGDSSVTRGKIMDGAIDVTKLTNGAVTSAVILNGTIATDDLGDSSVTTVKIADTNITTGKIYDLAVTTAKIADASINSNKLASASVWGSNIVDSVINTNHVSTNILDFVPAGLAFVNGTTTGKRGNVSSISRLTTGIYQIIFNTAYSSTNYVVTCAGGSALGTPNISFTVITNLTSGYTVQVYQSGSGLFNGNFYTTFYKPID